MFSVKPFLRMASLKDMVKIQSYKGVRHKEFLKLGMRRNMIAEFQSDNKPLRYTTNLILGKLRGFF